MGTRVDFYVGRGENAEWLGSYPFDGYPHGVFSDAPELFASPRLALEEWRAWVAAWLADAERSDRATLPEHGWPWPWDDSRTTDYAYAWDDGAVYGCGFGYVWFQVDPEGENWGEDTNYDGPKTATFPDMSGRKAVTYGPRSGLIVLEFPGGAP